MNPKYVDWMRNIPWQIWVVVARLGVAVIAGDVVGVWVSGNPHIWPAANCLFIIGLLRKSKWTYILFLVVTLLSFLLTVLVGLATLIVASSPAFPAALLHFATLALAASAAGFYFPRQTDSLPPEETGIPSL